VLRYAVRLAIMLMNLDSRPIALVGLMGAGKSTVARALGERLGAAVADLDAMAEAERGCSVAELFEREGEPAFRKLEGRILEQALAAGAGIISCGGGIVLDPAHRGALVARCRVVWLEVSPAAAALRLASTGGSRPLLVARAAGETIAPFRRLEALLVERRPLYEEVAQVRVSVEGRTVDEVADEVLRVLGRRAG
jgi:shikimate kinase